MRYIIEGSTPRRLQPKPIWRPHFRSGPAPSHTEAQIAYHETHRQVGHNVSLGYGIDARGPWAKVGDARARARTPEDAIRAALAQHLEETI